MVQVCWRDKWNPSRDSNGAVNSAREMVQAGWRVEFSASPGVPGGGLERSIAIVKLVV